MIPQETIEQVRQATDIAQVIGAYLKLKRRGRNSVAICPFHTEKTPSFSVSHDKQIYHCFGCGKGGNVFTFLMEHERMAFVDAVKYLARQANIPIREERQDDGRREAIEKIAYANHLAVEYYAGILNSPRYKNVLQDYLLDKRKISAEAIEHFKLGLAGEEWDGFLNFANDKGLSNSDLIAAGLAAKSDRTGGTYDRFRYRLMIPIFNLSQKPIAFGGRILKKGEQAKYINSPETPLYTKGNVLYGLNSAKDFIRDTKFVYVVEGYFDVISLWQAGIQNVVASSGTAFTPQQARLLARFAEEVYLFFDADSAGRQAALKSVDALYDSGLEVKVIDPSAGEDPDSIAREFGRDKIEELHHDALEFIPYRVRDLNLEKTGIIGKEKLVKELASIGTRIADPTRRSLFFAEAAERLGVDAALFRSSATDRRPGATANAVDSKKHDPLETNFLSLLFHSPGAIDSVFESISTEDFDSKELSRLYAALASQYQILGNIDTQKLIDSAVDAEFISLITEVAAKEWEPEVIDSELAAMIKQINGRKQKRVRTRLTEELRKAEAAGDTAKADQIMQELRNFGL